MLLANPGGIDGISPKFGGTLHEAYSPDPLPWSELSPIWLSALFCTN